MPETKVNGAMIHFELTGTGPVVMQVPGAVTGLEGYATVTPEMAKHFTVLDFDPRGYGLSDRPQQRYSFEVWAKDMVGLLDALDIGEAHVHGGSMGSSLALYFAARHPRRVRGLVVSGCTAKSDFMAKTQYRVWKALARAFGTGSEELALELCSKAVSREFLDGPQGGEALVEAVKEAAGRLVSADVFCDACDALIEVDVTEDLADITAPTLVIVGTDDILTPEHQAPSGAGGRYIYEHLTSARRREYVLLEGSGHGNLMDSPDECLAAIVPFLQHVDRELGG